LSKQTIAGVEKQIFELTTTLNQLRKKTELVEVPNYHFSSLVGEVKLLDLFGDKDTLLLIHNMGQGCRYCTLWADGFNGFIKHLESIMSVVLVSKDSPEVQREFANSRGWAFNLASHGGGDYIQQQSVVEGASNMPGVVIYKREGKSIYRQNHSVFGPGDLYCSMWSLLALAGIDEADWTPQYNYWQRPIQLDDGGENLNDN